MNEKELTGLVIHHAIDVHRQLGPGLLESVYEVCLEKILVDQGLRVERQKPIPIVVWDLSFAEGFRADRYMLERF